MYIVDDRLFISNHCEEGGEVDEEVNNGVEGDGLGLLENAEIFIISFPDQM